MRAIAKINDLKSNEAMHTIVRNLSRILDIRIFDIDVDSRTVSLIYDSLLAFEKAKMELKRIGFPIARCTFQAPNTKSVIQDYQKSE